MTSVIYSRVTLLASSVSHIEKDTNPLCATDKQTHKQTIEFTGAFFKRLSIAFILVLPGFHFRSEKRRLITQPIRNKQGISFCLTSK